MSRVPMAAFSHLRSNTVEMRAADWKTLAWWMVGIAMAACGLAWILRTESGRLLDASAEQASQRWTRAVVRSVPDLESVLGGQGLTPAARDQLLQLGRDDDVFRFRLFDATGRLQLASEDLLQAAPLPRPDDSDGIGRGSAESRASLRAKVLAGASHTEVRRDGAPGLPPVFSQSYVPVVLGGRLRGVVEVYVDQTRRVANAHAAMLRIGGAVALLVAALLGLVLYLSWWRLRRQRHAISRVRYAADHDAVSGALNRTSFNALLEQACRRSADGAPPFALLCIDLDHFKDVNDSLGHAAGDEVLRLATQRLQSCVREGDQVARLGGDEFAVVFFGVACKDSVTPLAQRVVAALARVYDLSQQQVRCSGSVGVAVYGVDATEPGELLGRADMALYRAKASGRGTYSFYDVAMDLQMQARRSLTRDLREALAAGQFSLHYQPLYSRDAQTLTGYEALLRWSHPTRGDVPPSEFIALAEENGVINEIGSWVLNKACQEAASWPAPMTVAVNLSALQFADHDLEQLVARALADSGLPAHRLELEITESLLMSNTERVLGVLRALSGMGVTIAMDDFGTGYSSLAYLWRFPFDKVKIDRAFTHNLGHDAKVALIVHSIISLAHSLDIRVNAEGVETPSQMAALQEGGCDELQGFLLGAPAPASALTHSGYAELATPSGWRTEPRRSFFGTIPLPLPLTRTGPIV